MGFTNEAVMTVRRVTLDGQEYVLIPRRHWEAMTRRGSARAGKPLKMPPLSEGAYTLDHVRISLANKMLARRKAAGMTQAHLARLARVRVETISRLENGLHMPSANVCPDRTGIDKSRQTPGGVKAATAATLHSSRYTTRAPPKNSGRQSNEYASTVRTSRRSGTMPCIHPRPATAIGWSGSFSAKRANTDTIAH